MQSLASPRLQVSAAFDYLFPTPNREYRAAQNSILLTYTAHEKRQNLSLPITSGKINSDYRIKLQLPVIRRQGRSGKAFD
jgi:hypothetical protein